MNISKRHQLVQYTSFVLSKMSLNIRSKSEIFLIGFPECKILGAKLPTSRQLFRTYFYNKNIVKLDHGPSVSLAVREAIIFWEKARIETKRFDHCVEKFEQLYQEWLTLKKSKTRVNDTENMKRRKFTEDKLDMLFDIAHESALEKLKGDDKQFLLNQRSKGREGCLLGVDQKQTKKEERRNERLGKEEARKRKYIEQQEREKKGIL